MVDASAHSALTESEVRRLCGDLSDATVKAILRTGGGVADVQAAVFQDQGNGEPAPVSDAAAAIRRIIEEDAGWNDEFD
jgi:hypothetical protein